MKQWYNIRLGLYGGLYFYLINRYMEVHYGILTIKGIIISISLIILTGIIIVEQLIHHRKYYIMDNKLTFEYIESKGFKNLNDRGMSENGGSMFNKGNIFIQYWTTHPRLHIKNIYLGTILETDCKNEITKDDFDNIIKILGI